MPMEVTQGSNEEIEKFHWRVPKDQLTATDLANEVEKLIQQVDRIEESQQRTESTVKAISANLIKNAYLDEDANNQLAARTVLVSGFNQFNTHNDPKIFENQCIQRDYAISQVLLNTNEILPQSCQTTNLAANGTLSVTNWNRQMEMSHMSVVVLEKPYQRNVLFKFLKENRLERGIKESIHPGFCINNDPSQGPDPWKLGNGINQDNKAGWLTFKREIALHNRIEGIALKAFMQAYNQENKQKSNNGGWELAPDWNGNSVVLKMAQDNNLSGYVAFFAYNKYNFTCTVYLSTEILNTDNSEANDVIERFHKIMKKNLKATKGKGKGKGKKGKGKNKGDDSSDSDLSSSHSDDDLNLLDENSDQEMDNEG